MMKTEVITMAYEKGIMDATYLRAKAVSGEADDTEIINEEIKVPNFDHEKDYTSYPIGTPVKYGGQVYGLLQPHNASFYDGGPAENRALWGLKHTKNSAKAKPFVAPYGTSGMYMAGECCTDPDAEDPTVVYKCVNDNNVYAPHEYAQAWVVL